MALRQRVLHVDTPRDTLTVLPQVPVWVELGNVSKCPVLVGPGASLLTEASDGSFTDLRLPVLLYEGKQIVLAQFL